MTRNVPDSSSLEQTLVQYLGSSRSDPPDLRQLLVDRPEVAQELRRLLDEHERATAADEPTLLQNTRGRGTQPATTPADHRPEAETLPLSAQGPSPDGPPPSGPELTIECHQRPGPGTTAAPRTRFGDYELLDEIARGGMGVVYRARQISLDRQVALKMILSGQLAAEDDVSRFYAEAESAARLDHPGIVPVFEVGQHDGQHFYAMGFVQGTSLAERVRHGPLICTEAADIMRQVAEAVHYAHQRGVIHRDLKPANVLMDTQGQVRITDFGLAKRIDHDSQLTASGQVLGTPGYMPPEQARGQLEAISPASDVYAMGAVLYAMLTGRPPFQASTPVDTLMQVLERDPMPPRQLSPNADPDLETICMKCLQKDPQQRYVSAQEVAAEIVRYQRGEPLLARPVSPWELLARWYTRLRNNKMVRVRSTGGIGRIPWVDIAVGPDTETGESRGVARGFIAIGDKASGVVACGQTARGIVALGQSSYGVLAVGVKSMGLVSVGATGMGLVSISAVSVGLIAFGGLATGWAAVGGVAVGWYAFGAAVTGKHVIGIGKRDPVAIQFFGPWLENLVLRLGEWFTVVMLLSFAAAILVALRGKIKAITWRARHNGERTR